MTTPAPQMTENPYQSPLAEPDTIRPPDADMDVVAMAVRRVRLVGSVLALTAAGALLVNLLGGLILFAASTSLRNASSIGALIQRDSLASIGVYALSLAVPGMVVGCASRMAECKSRGYSLLAPFLAFTPLLGPCLLLSFPIGIWALVVLMSPDVRMAFLVLADQSEHGARDPESERNDPEYVSRDGDPESE